MKTDDRMAERIAHLERDIKILKNEVQAVLVDLKEKYMQADNPLNKPLASASGPEVIVVQAPAAGEARSGSESHGSSAEKEEKEKTEEPAGAAEDAKDKKGEAAEAVEGGDHKDEDEGEAGVVKDKTGGHLGEEEEAGGAVHPEAALEEVLKAYRPEELSCNVGMGKEKPAGREINLISVSGLVNWAEESVKKLGLQRTEAILDVAELMGLLSPQLKQIMTKLVHVGSGDISESVSARAFLDSLVKITTLLGKDNQTEAALLSILSGEVDDG